MVTSDCETQGSGCAADLLLSTISMAADARGQLLTQQRPKGTRSRVDPTPPQPRLQEQERQGSGGKKRKLSAVRPTGTFEGPTQLDWMVNPLHFSDFHSPTLPAES